MSNPMEQFVVKPIIPIKVGDIDISFTNSSLFMVLAVVLSTLIFAFCLRRRSIIPSVSQSIPESIYGFIASLIKENIGPEGLKYFYLIFTISCLSLSATFSACFPMLLPLRRTWQPSAACPSLPCCLTSVSASKRKNSAGCALLCPRESPLLWHR